MEGQIDHEYWLNFIICDSLPFEHNGRLFFISSPSRENKFAAESFFLEYYRKALDGGALSEEGISKLLLKYNIWNPEKEKTMTALEKDMENIKVNMFENYLSSNKVQTLREGLNQTKKLWLSFSQDKSSFDSLSAKSLALSCKQHFLVGCSIFVRKGKPFWKNPLKCWKISDEVLGSAYHKLNDHILTEDDYRELARSNSWRNIWSTRKGAGNFWGRAVVDLSSHQRHLLAWSNLYDNVYKNSSVPSDEVINDNDLLDGWMIVQRRKRESEAHKSYIESKTSNKKILSSEEVFVMSTADNFDKVFNMNDLEGKIAFKRRMAQIQREGIVEETQMMDRQMEIRKQISKGG